MTTEMTTEMTWTLTTYTDRSGLRRAIQIPHTDGTFQGVRAAIEAAIAAGAPEWIRRAEGAVDEDGEYLLGDVIPDILTEEVSR